MTARTSPVPRPADQVPVEGRADAAAVRVELAPRASRPLRVTLVRGPVVTMPASLSTHGPTPPIGLAYIAAVLTEAGHDVTLVDGAGAAIDRMEDFDSPVGPLRRTGLSPKEIVEEIPDAPDLVGITLMFVHEWAQVREIAEGVRARFPDTTIVVGGETATSFWRWMFAQTDAIDHVVLGEGEATAVAIAERLSLGLPVSPMEGVVSFPGDDDGNGGLPTRIRALSTVPRPAWHLVDLESYWRHPYFGVHRGRSMPVLATRGCPYKCSFCSSPQMWTTRYVVREPEDLADEIADHVDRYGVRNINFCDLTAITKRKWTLRFCDALEARGLDITWQLPVGTRAEALDEEVLQRLYDTGCRNVVYAPESGSQRMLDIYGKKVDLEHILRSLRSARKVGIRTHVNIIIGHPDERWSDVVKSLRYLVRAAVAGCDDAAAIMFAPYPGSADFERLVAEGRLEVDEASLYIGVSRSSSWARSFNSQMSARQLRVVQLALMGVFYGCAIALHPRRLVAFVRSQRSGEETTYLDQMVRSLRAARASARARSPRGRRSRPAKRAPWPA